VILFFGPPGSGKSVQGQLLVERNGWQWLSTGDLFRKSKDPEVLKRMASGELIDDELTAKVLDEALAGIGRDIQVVLDGYPRNLQQAERLEKQLPKFGRKVACVILFEVSREELISRLVGRGRTEDTEEIINRRLDIYDSKTSPVVNFYSDKSVPVLAVDGEGDINEIHERIQTAVQSCLKP
jgi:adenylate kinase